ncbi:porin family protein [Dyadobacter sp. CY345]|uniref:outer membrane beta-barrel protein n=1 Tax=Dyadobacter sp. CY345 TaxID=2909335 RepID=UPI001F1965B3|nr:outer membrane beta-barrel protein [Dyadobacter sp. CY345]MCF2444118.1 porin family protein [Dyadobacter sp. CY345]
MKKLFGLSTLLLLSFFFSGTASAQKSLTLLGTYGITNQSDDSDGAYGFGAQYRYFVKPNMAIGLSAKYITEDINRELSLKTIRGRATNIPVNLMGEYYFGSRGIKPYVGLEVGLNIQKIEGFNIIVDKSTIRPGVSPKVGIILPMGRRLQFMVEGSYDVVIGSANSVNVDATKIGNELYSVKNSNQSITVTGGIRYIFGKMEKKVKPVPEP